MTNTPHVDQNYPQPSPAPPQQPGPKQKNVLGLVALIVAAVGFIFACIPGALIVGWILLPVAFILGIVSLFMKGKPKGMGITAIIVSVVGTIVGVIVFMAVVATAVDEAFGGGESTVITPDDEAEPVADEEEPAGAVEGTRDNPYPIGTTIEQGDWSVTINSVNLDATNEVTVENLFNEAPDEGTQYMMVNLTATYNGDDPDGATPWVTVNYVTADGNTIDGLEKMLVAPDSFDLMTTLYNGASEEGNEALQIPADTAADGVLVVSPTMAGDKFYFNVQ